MTPTRRWAMVLSLCLGSFMILLDTTIVYVATPAMMSELHAPIDEVLWVINGYLLTFAALLITTGLLADYVGPKALFLAGLIVFTLASAACGVSQNVDQLILARIIQGVGGALLTPQTMTLIAATFPPQRRGSAFGIFGAVVGLATVGGPTIGGLLVTVAGWRWFFFLNVPVGIVAVIATLLFVVDVRPGRRQPGPDRRRPRYRCLVPHRLRPHPGSGERLGPADLGLHWRWPGGGRAFVFWQTRARTPDSAEPVP